ncbi:MAG: carboxypeptidase regulatory-like domain-containing protein [Crocinitomicaceae bacterium]|nr:carboxypeptidase regulatory-like domain-containing protein [Crocinitomicaceae bacterium]
MKNLLLVSILLLSFAGNSQTGSIRGVVIDKATYAMIPFTKVSIHKLDGTYISSVQASIDAIYNLPDLKEGKYLLKFFSPRYSTTEITDVRVLNGKMTMQKAYLSMLTHE